MKIIMYHYIRDLEHSRYPGIKGRTVDEFRKQLDWLMREDYFFAGLINCVQWAHGINLDLMPEKTCLLTFDDGYADHYTHVFPLLAEREITGAFFPPASAIMDRQVLDVNKIHFLLASNDGAYDSAAQVKYLMKSAGLDVDALYDEHAVASRYDRPDTVFVKRMLQYVLPRSIRRTILNRLFHEYVTQEETMLANELYMTPDQIRHMHANGMEFGCHGVYHPRLTDCTEARQAAEIDDGLTFLRDLEVLPDAWTMCYPYGAYNETTIRLLKERGCALGLTTEPKVAALTPENALTLPRLDTNDVPCVG